MVILAMQENPADPGAECLDLGVLVVLGLTGPLAPVLSPLLLLRPMLFGWNRYNKLFITVALAVILVQGWLVLNSGRIGVQPEPKNWGGIFRMLVREFVPQLFVGQGAEPLWGWFWSSQALRPRFVCGREPRPAHGALRRCCYSPLGLVLGTTVVCGPIPHTYNAFAGGQRYFYVPYVLIAWFYLLGLDSPQSRVRQIAAGVSAMIMLAAVTHLMSPHFPTLIGAGTFSRWWQAKR